MKIVAIIQARMTSTRLPGKVLQDFFGRPMLEFMLERVKKSKRLDQIIVATTSNSTDDSIVELCIRNDICYFRGSEHDVLQRFFEAAKYYDADVIVRLCSDCPLIDPIIIDELIQNFLQSNYDYLNNIRDRTYPDGLDVEVFNFETLSKTYELAKESSHREHVTTYMDGRTPHLPHGNFNCGFVKNAVYYGDLMWSVNTIEQLEHIKKLVSGLKNITNFSWTEVLEQELKMKNNK